MSDKELQTSTASSTPDTDSSKAGASQTSSRDAPMSLMDHLHELRSRLMRILIVIFLGFIACYGVSELLFAELVKPLTATLPQGSKLIFTALPEAFFVYMKVGFVASIFLTSPYTFYQIWAFIAPGLYEEERRFIVPIAGFSAFFFLAGAAFCYLIVFPFAFSFFMSFATDTIAPMPSLDEYLGFSLKLLIAFGLIFEMPLFSFFLARMSLISAAKLRTWRKYSVLVIFIVAAILTPPDVISQLLMAAPMLLLYELSIWVAAAAQKRPKNGVSAQGEAKTGATGAEAPTESAGAEPEPQTEPTTKHTEGTEAQPVPTEAEQNESQTAEAPEAPVEPVGSQIEQTELQAEEPVSSQIEQTELQAEEPIEPADPVGSQIEQTELQAEEPMEPADPAEPADSSAAPQTELQSGTQENQNRSKPEDAA